MSGVIIKCINKDIYAISAEMCSERIMEMKENELSKVRKASEYLNQLSNGISPLTGRALTPDEINAQPIKNCLRFSALILDKVHVNGGVYYGDMRKSFFVTDGEMAKIGISDEPAGISDIVKRINAAIDTYEVRELKLHMITSGLIRLGYLAETEYNGKRIKTPTKKGSDAGISSLESTSAKGVRYMKNVFNSSVQRYIAENINLIVKEENAIEHAENE